MLMLTDRVCGNELLTTRRPLSRSVLSNINFRGVYGTPLARPTITSARADLPGIAGPPACSADGLQPVVVKRLALVRAHARFIATRGAPGAQRLLQVGPQAHA